MKRVIIIVLMAVAVTGIGLCKECECGAYAQQIYEYCMNGGGHDCNQAAVDAYRQCMLWPD